MQCRVIHFTSKEAAERRAREINQSFGVMATGNKAIVRRDGKDGYKVIQPIGC